MGITKRPISHTKRFLMETHKRRDEARQPTIFPKPSDKPAITTNSTLEMTQSSAKTRETLWRQEMLEAKNKLT